MSQILILNTSLGLPQINPDLLAQISNADETMANFISTYDFSDLIKEIAEATIKSMINEVPGVQAANKVLNYYGTASSETMVGVLKTNQLSNGLGIKLGANNQIQFLVDEYRSEWQKESKRLQSLFANQFTAQALKTILGILGYQVDRRAFISEHGNPSVHLMGVKQ